MLYGVNYTNNTDTDNDLLDILNWFLEARNLSAS